MRRKRDVLKILYIVSLSILLGGVGIRPSQAEDSWTTKTPMPTERLDSVSGVVDGKIYVIGGWIPPQGARTNKVEVYDPITDTWTEKAPLPDIVVHTAAGVVNGKIYVIGGDWDINPMTAGFEYDPLFDTWTSIAPVPTARWGHNIGVVNGKIYVIGGAGSAGYKNEMYDPIKNTWTTKAPMPTTWRDHLGIAVVDNKIYAIGGRLGFSSSPLGLNEEYDPDTDTWTTKAPMLTGRAGFYELAVVDNKIYVMGGENGVTDSVYSENEMYDPVTDTWTAMAPLPTPRHGMSIQAVNNKIYTIGGGPLAYYDWGNINEEYTPPLAANQPPDISAIPDSLSKNEGETITKAEIELATDPDGDPLTYTYSGWLSSLPYTTTYDDAGTHILHVDVSDGTDTRGKDITVVVTDVPLTYTITATAGTGGSINPSGNVIVNEGADQTFTITADTGYLIDDVLVDEVSQGAVSNYEFTNVTSDHTIEATFAVVSAGRIIYVDGSLENDCTSGNYSIANRDGSGSDGDAYIKPQDAADIVNPGDIVYFREGTYYNHYQAAARYPVMNILRSGTIDNPLMFKNYNNEEVILSGEWIDGNPYKYSTIALGIRPSDQQDISGQGVQNIIIEGLIVEGASKEGLGIFGPANQNASAENPTENVIIRRVIARNNEGQGITSSGKLVNVVIEYCEAYNNTGLAGIGFGRVSKVWHHSEPEDDMSAAHNSVIRNCLAYNNINPERPGDTDGIAGSNMYNCTIENNVVFGNSDDGIDFYASIESTAKNNIIFGHSYEGGNNCGLKFAAGGGGRFTIEGNVVFNNDSYSFEGSNPKVQHVGYYPSKIYGNLAYNGDSGFSLGTTYNLTYPGFEKAYLRDNIALDNVGRDIFNALAAYVDSDYNFISDPDNLNTMQSRGLDLNSLTGDPQLANKEVVIDTNFDPAWSIEQKLEHIRSQVREAFSPLKESILIDAGIIVEGYHNPEPGDKAGDGKAWYGNAPDIGAYEYTLLPVAVIQNEPKQGYAPLTVSFDGSQSTSPNGDIVSYEWDFGDGVSSQEKETSHTYTSPGEYTVTLKVTDIQGYKGQAQTHIIASSSNQPPVANAGQNQTVIDEENDGEEQVTLDGSGSLDPDGTIVSFVWSEDGSQIATGVNPNVVLSTGTHSITLTVTDNGGLTDTDTVTIKVLKGDKGFGELPRGCYNNVFNPLKGERSLIVVELSKQAHVRLNLYNTRGKRIRELADEEKETGTHKYYWDGKSGNGDVVGSGLYFVHIQAGDYKKTKKIVVVK